jgi:hypothetical protein
MNLADDNILDDQEYHDFLKDCVLKSMANPEKPKYLVHFYCEWCQKPFTIKAAQILQAAMEVDQGGCKCCGGPANQCKLTHHDELQAEDGEVDISEFTKIIPL